MAPATEQIARVGLPLALAEPLRYLVPPEMRDLLRPGHRVHVPLRGGRAWGIVIEIVREALTPGLRPILAVDPQEVLLESQLLRLVKWVAHYYVAPLGVALEAAVPQGVARPPRDGDEATLPGSALSDGTSQPPTCAQGAALEQIRQAIESHSCETFLLQGVTGSGKTEVYLQAIAMALDIGRGALVLVPEIAMGIQVVARVRERFGAQVAEYHSHLPAAVRRRTWWSARRGAARIVIGARSAVFVPVADLGLIVVDEEHEPAYKQSETPRYHGRDTALMRARLAGAVTILGSATPALESRANAERGKYRRLLLPERVASRAAARVTLVDQRAAGSAPPAVTDLPTVREPASEIGEPLSAYLRQRLQEVVTAGDQAILFLNRRGFSTVVQCHDCGHIFECPRCSVVLTYHRAEKLLRCHYCNFALAAGGGCPGCGGVHFTYNGAGTQRVEAALAQHIPQARVLRMDFDSTRARGSRAEMIATFERGAADILLGTQMVAKGLDFPRVTLVGVINADREMGMPDFRAQERAFQLLTQVAGRAGRGEKPGEVLFQTYLPEHHVIAAAGWQDYERFYRSEMDERRSLRYPPLRRMANLLFDGADEEAVMRCASAEAETLGGRPGLELLGPAPMPLSRLKGQFRWHLTLLAARAGLLTATLHDALERARQVRPRGRVRLQVDMDPVSML